MKDRRRFSNVIGFDDAPFAKSHRGKVTVVGTVYAGTRLDGILVGRVQRDGTDATRELLRLVQSSKYAGHVRLVMLQGIALAGFNVVDAHKLSIELGLPVLVVARYAPDMGAVKRALLERIPGGARKWAIIERMGPMEPIANVYVQRVGLSSVQALDVVERFALHGHIPEPLRVAHLVAGGLGSGQSRGRA